MIGLRLLVEVKVIGPNGDILYYTIEKPAERHQQPFKSRKPTAPERALFLGTEFRGRDNEGTSRTLKVADLYRIACVPNIFYLSPRPGSELATGTLRLGDYDAPDERNSALRKHPLSGLICSFSIQEDEGIVFNDQKTQFCFVDSYVRSESGEFVVEDHLGEWRFAKLLWKLSTVKCEKTDYFTSVEIHDSLPELTQFDYDDWIS